MDIRSQIIVTFSAIEIVRDIRNGVLPICAMNRLQGVVAIIAPQLVDTYRPARYWSLSG